MPGECHTFTIDREQIQSDQRTSSLRLDLFLQAQEAFSYSRSSIRRLILAGAVTVNGRKVKPGYSLKERDTVHMMTPELRPLELRAEAIPLDIVFEDDDVLVLNKAVGMVVHPGPGHASGTLVHALLYHCRQDLSGIGGVQRPGIVHRLDRDTSGVMLVAKTDAAHVSLSEQLKSRTLSRVYTAITHGCFRAMQGRIDAGIGRHHKDRKKMAVDHVRGRKALSSYRVLEQFKRYSVLHVQLQTGRTHQIRVHMKHVQHPIVGDPVYGNRSLNNFNMTRQALHAHTICFIHPSSGEEMSYTTPLPNDMQRLLETLRKREPSTAKH
ncbi:RNA pseudouridine synthase [candidate division KSB3 bacterium]|uniref:Pseudouridine synthase n=1 Tax=candidate division KSB3 bacterium TaxID=2044937 RepID=A0A2G6E8H5_9BACT|nr:MAG: RNA pseudouridine synthase [candidate division KSB3 bacterium]PIE30420.1 MAG: RNA pseudouridine synthase [candidate division KSB3 bacterium]